MTEETVRAMFGELTQGKIVLSVILTYAIVGFLALIAWCCPKPND